MNPPAEMIRDLNVHFEATQELLDLVEREGNALRQADGPSLFEYYQARKTILPLFTESLERLRAHRLDWQRLSLAERATHPEVSALLRLCQDLTMKVIVLDRENEQRLLRRGLVPPRELPSVNRQRPHFVADLYRKAQVA